MAGETSILSSAIGFGIKEVADVAFYPANSIDVDDTGKIVKAADYEETPAPLLILDTLKVSTIENTAEQTDAKGGKGNAPLIIWDYGREITISLQDAVLSERTLSLMFEDNAAATATDGVITINANKFPGNYAVVGKTFARDIKTGKDHLFTWFVPNAKVSSEVTLTMEAEGDPTVFDMNLRVLRTSDGTMVKLIKAAAEVNTYSPETALTYANG